MAPAPACLLKQLRYVDAMKILLTDEPFDAQEALRIGLINEVVPHAQLLERAEKIARHIVTLPPVAVRMMKEFVVRFGDLPTDQAWHVQNLINNLLIQVTTDGEEGRQAFNEKRPPRLHRRPAPARRGLAGTSEEDANGSTRHIAAGSSDVSVHTHQVHELLGGSASAAGNAPGRVHLAARHRGRSPRQYLCRRTLRPLLVALLERPGAGQAARDIPAGEGRG